jgi:hypothetical protein
MLPGTPALRHLPPPVGQHDHTGLDWSVAGIVARERHGGELPSGGQV